MTLPEEEPRIAAVQSFGEKVIPGTVQSGQVNVKAQIDSSQQEWQGLVSTIQLAINSLEQKIQQWAEFESKREQCLSWLKNIDTQLHTFNLKSTLQEKSGQLEELKNMQGVIRAKELEIDSVTEKAQQLHKGLQPMRSSQITELTVKHQQVSMKVKDLILRWQQYVSTHTEYNAVLKECREWLSAKGQELGKISSMGLGTQAKVDGKLKSMSELLLCKEDGFAKVQRAVDLAQTVLANTDASGHDEIKQQGRYSVMS